jgi:hypothetical protein
VAEIGGVVERVPVAYLDGGDADRHGVLFMDARSLRQCLLGGPCSPRSPDGPGGPLISASL